MHDEIVLSVIFEVDSRFQQTKRNQLSCLEILLLTLAMHPKTFSSYSLNLGDTSRWLSCRIWKLRSPPTRPFAPPVTFEVDNGFLENFKN